MRITGYEHSSVSSQTMKFEKFESDCSKVPKQADTESDGVINPQNYNFDQF